MDFLKPRVGNFLYHMLLILISVESHKNIGHFSEEHDRVYWMKEREITCFKNVECEFKMAKYENTSLNSKR